MTRTNKTRSALFTSIISLLLCVSMLVGTTFAWFTDTAATGVNTIQSGNLDLVLEWHNGDGKWAEVTAETLLFNKDALYEPGFTEVAYLRVSNAGSLTLKYILTVNVANEVAGINKAGESFKLSDHIKFGVITTEVGGTITPYTTREAAQADAVKNGDVKNLQSFSTNDYVTLEHEDAIEMALVVYMPTTVGNEANHDGVNKPSITMGVNVFATQKDAEEDSYGSDYDKNAPTIITVGTDSTVYTTLNEALNVATEGATIKVSGPAKYDFGTESNQTLDGNNVVIEGADDSAYVIFQGNGANNTLANVTLKNLTVVDETTSYAESAWELGYLELANITAENVVFQNGIMLDGITTYATSYDNTFVGCTFIGKTDDGLKMYGAWVNSGSASFTNCTFTGTRGLKVHEAYDSEVSTVVIDKCTFKNLTEKPAIALGTLNPATAITIKNITIANVQPGDQGMYIYESDTDVGTFEFTVDSKPVIASQTAFAKAMAAAEDGDTLCLSAGKYTMVSVTGKTVNITGTKDAVLTLAESVTCTGATINFQGITIQGATPANKDNWVYIEQLKDATKATYTNCTINNLITTFCPSEFTNCVFENEGKDQYSVFCYASSKITDCTFNVLSKAVKLYNNNLAEMTLDVSGCTFNGAEFDKAAIEIDSSASSKYTVNIKNCTTNEYYTKLWNDKGTNSVVIVDGIEYVAEGLGKDAEGTYLVSSATGLVNFEKLVNNGNMSFNGVTVKLTANVDMTGINWTPIGQTGATQFQGTFDGQGYTISNLTIDTTDKLGASNKEYSTGLFGWLNAGTVKNVIIDNANITGVRRVGAIAGYLEQGATVENCQVINSTITSEHIGESNDNDDCGDKAGGVVGYMNGNCKVTNCSVTNTAISAGRDAGCVVGAGYTAAVTGCTYQNVTVTSCSDTCKGGNLNAAVIGRVLD